MTDNKSRSIILIFTLFFVFIFILLAVNVKKEHSIIGNKVILNEINHLFGPLENGNITEQDFDKLKIMLKNDKYASGEIDEMLILLKYNETVHMGHSLGFLYFYIENGEEPICPGHLLSHYYVFMRHGEEDLAKDNLGEAKDILAQWKTQAVGSENYTYYNNLFEQVINNIDKGNASASDEEINVLSEAYCSNLR